MKGTLRRWAPGLVAAMLVLAVGAASAQGLWYKEVEKDGRIYVFNTSARYEEWVKSGNMGNPISFSNHGPYGETVIAENETAIDLYNLKHDLPGYDRPAPKPAPPPSNPSRLKIGSNGELWFGGLVQGWYIADASVRTTGSQSDYLGNTTGYNTFRLRRAEMKMQGKFGSDWGFVVMIDPAKSINTSSSSADGKILQDLAVQFFGLKGSEFAIGQLKIDVTEEGMRSSSELWFGERAQITRAISDIRQPGFFYKGNLGEYVTLWSAITNGQVPNTLSDTNDTLLYTGRIDFKPMKGLIIGASGGTGQTTGGTAHRNVSRFGAHVQYGGYGVPGSKLWLESEYGQAHDTQVDGSTLKRWGMYASALYLFGDHFQVGFRYDAIRNNTDLPRTSSYIYTTGVHWLQFGKNLNLKGEWYYVNVDGRTVNGISHCCYSEYLLAAQAAF